MKVGDLVRYKHFPDETGVVVEIHTHANRTEAGTIDVLSATGEITVCLNPEAFEVINER